MFSAGSDFFFKVTWRNFSGAKNIAHAVHNAGAFQRVKLADSEVGNSSYHMQGLQTHGTLPHIPNTWLLTS